MIHKCSHCLVLACALGILTGCSSYQPTKDVWKGTKDFWYTYASPPASINYNDTGALPEAELQLSRAMLAIDRELDKFQRVMLNADRPPTNEWVQNLLTTFPWVSGIAGVKYDGVVLGQEPTTPMKELDFNPLLYEDPKQKRNALRGDVQNTPLGPEVILAAPLYESNDFLGIVAAHFDMRALASQSNLADKLVILSPAALLWPGSYSYAETPLAQQNWAKVCRESSQGTCSNKLGSFLYQVRYLGNIPLVFAVVEKGSFPKGDGSTDQGKRFFPENREKLPPPALPKPRKEQSQGIPVFGGDKGENLPELQEPGKEELEPTPVRTPEPPRQKRVRRRPVERMVPVERPRVQKPVKVTPDLNLPTEEVPKLPGGRPSPFGTNGNSSSEESRPTATPPKTNNEQTLPGGRPNPFGTVSPSKTPESSSTTKQESPKNEPSTLPGGRPNPFGS